MSYAIKMMKTQQIKEFISTQLGKTLSADGFRYYMSVNEFRRTCEEFTFTFNIVQTAWSNSHSINISLYISQHQVEKILEIILGKQRHKITIGRDIDRIFNSPDGREVVNGNLSIWLQQEEDIEAAIESLQWYYNDIAKPYFNRYNNMEALDDIINNPPFDHCPAHVGGNFDERCMKGLIVARLVSNPNYENLLMTYDQEIKHTMDSESIDNYYKVREYLSYNSIEI